MTFMRVLLSHYRTRIHRQIRRIALNPAPQVAGMRPLSDKPAPTSNSLELFLKEELRNSSEVPERADPPVGWNITTAGTKFTLQSSRCKTGTLTVEADTADSYELLRDEPEEEEEDGPSRYPLLRIKHVNNGSTLEMEVTFDQRDGEEAGEAGAITLAVLNGGETVVISKILVTDAQGNQLYCGEEYADPELWNLMWQKLKSLGVNEAFLDECIKVNELHDGIAYTQFLNGVLNHFRN